jgi:hypothetical protein
MDEKILKAYAGLFKKFAEINIIPINEWSYNHLLGYFCQKYKEFYKTDYQFGYDKPQPSKCMEVFTIQRLLLLVSSDPVTIKDYIDFVFEKRVSKSKRKLTSITFMMADFLMTEFKTIYQLKQTPNQKIDRTTKLPKTALNFLKLKNIQIETYGDVGFLIESGELPDIANHIKTLLNYDKIKDNII